LPPDAAQSWSFESVACADECSSDDAVSFPATLIVVCRFLEEIFVPVPRLSSVVAVGPHPDDVEVFCMGALLKLQAEGTRITIVCLTNGELGSSDKPDVAHAEVVATRFREASSVAESIGAEFVNLGAQDGYLEDNRSTRNALEVVLRRSRAEVVFAPAPTDYQSDHTIGSEIAFNACHLAALPQLGTKVPALDSTPALYYYDTALGLDFQPSFYIDISETIERKKQLARLHVSQMANMKARSNWDLVEAIEIQNRFRGLQAGVAYAEGFQLCTRYPRLKAWKQFPA
jgi:LmbE family N-acetylglucosaminyl deacetylase